MVCCANYWRMHEVDEAGRVGSRLQKILFFLSALVMLTFLTLNPLMVLGGTAALVLYGIGLHGAQKRNAKALGFYGTTMLCSVITTILMVAFVGGFLVMGGARHMQHHYGEARVVGRHHGRGHWRHSMTQAVHEHAVSNLMSMSESSGFITYDHEHVADDGTPFTLVDLVPSNGNNGNSNAAEAPRVEIEAVRDDLVRNERGEQFELVTLETARKPAAGKPADVIIGDAVKLAELQVAAEAEADEADAEGASAHSEVEPDEQPRVRTCRITTLGYVALFFAIFTSLLCFALKVRSIKLAFQMRAMLLANARQQLPLHTRTGSAGRSRPTPQRASAPSTRGVRPPQTPAPLRRRDCAACTFVNVASATRCAMCDSPLPFAAAPAGVAPPPASSTVPRVYVPGSLYPLNAPLN